MRMLARVHLAAACIPLLYLVVVNIAYAAARLTLGEWPGMQNHPHATVPLYWLWAAMPLVYIIALISVSGAWLAAAHYMQRTPAGAPAVRRELLGVLVAWMACWSLALLLMVWDPIRAFSWLLD
jgi:hypothetical protein